MPCLILTGHPSAGKTTLAELFRERALQYSSKSVKKVVIINEESACPDHPKADCYATSQAEKSTRAALKAAFDRTVAASDSTTLVILDSLNYIKGFRYELYCISKAAKELHGVVWVLNEVRLAQEWNRKRRADKPDECYSDELMQELIQRYEPPDARNRWDSPLYRVDVRPPGLKTSGLAQETLERSVYNMHKLSDAIGDEAAVSSRPAVKKSAFKRAGFKRAGKPEVPSQEEGTTASKSEDTKPLENDTRQGKETPAKEQTLEETIDEILNSFLSEKPLQEGASTRQHIASDSDALHDIDTITYQVSGKINAAQNKATTATGRLLISVDGENLPFEYRRRLPPTELKRLRRQYMQWIATHPPEDSSEKGIAHSFLAYVEAQQ